MKKVFAKVCAVLMAAALYACPALAAKGATAETGQGAQNATPIDMYLIAGQSNAAGYSTKGIDLLDETFENVGYGGEVQRNFRTGLPSSSKYLTFDKFVWGVRSGLGASSGYVGPEYGIAKAINEQYENQPDGRKAFIFKTAAGGTALRDVDGDVGTTTYNWGNWYPRSLWEDGYAPNTATNVETNDATGYLYALFVENFEKVYNELKDNGYVPVVKGFAWMQGCNDLGHHDLYETLMKTFIQDMREDLVQITGDSTLYSMPFVQGEIATTFGYYGNVNVPAFNTMQRKVATDMGDSVATVPTADLIINNADGTVNGTDIYHFNCADAETLGVRFGEKLLELNGKSFVSVSYQQEGEVSFVVGGDGKITFTIEPTVGEKKYKLNKFFINDVDVTSGVVNGTYVLENPTSRTHAKAEFVELTRYAVNYDLDKKYVGIVDGMRWVYEGDDLRLEFAAKDGYEITKVTAGGVELVSLEEGKHVYLIENVSADVEIAVEYKKIAQEPIGKDEGQGCAGAVSLLPLAAVAIVAAVRVCKRKEN